MNKFINKKYVLTVLLFCFMIIKSNSQTSSSYNVPSISISPTGISKGATVFGVFEGRPPCQELAKQMNVTVSDECYKIKWRLTLFKDSVTGRPTDYQFEGSFFREKIGRGKWIYVKGMPGWPEASVILLNPNNPQQLFYLLKGDDNVLFILDQKRNFRVGNDKFSYTLNRVNPN